MSDDSSSGRIVEALRSLIADAAPGTKLPSSRTLVAEYGASPVTVQKALRLLAGQGLVEARPGVGTFVRAGRTVQPSDYGWQTAALGAAPAPGFPLSSALRTPPNEVVALHSGFPDRELQPERLVRAALARLARSESAHARPPAAGLPELQAWFAAELAQAASRGSAPPAARDVVVLPGSQSGLSAAFRSLAGPGGALLVESPTYWGAVLAARQAGVRMVPVPSGPSGPDPADLDRAFEQSGARALYAQPSFANPTGALWPASVAQRVLEVVRRHGAFLIEDDWAHDFGIDADPAPLAARDADGHVVYLRSLTKSVSPSIRVAAIVARGPARDRILADVQAQALYVSALLQAAALDVVTSAGWDRHRAEVRRRLRERRNGLAAALARYVPHAQLTALPRGGLHLWVRLPDGTDLPRLVRDCDDAGVAVAPGDEWFPAEPTGPFLRLNFSGPNPGAWPAAAQSIGAMLDRQR